MLTMQIGFNRTLLVAKMYQLFGIMYSEFSRASSLLHLCCASHVPLLYILSPCHPSYDHRVKKTSFCYHMRGSMTLAEYSLILMFIFIAGCLCVGFELGWCNMWIWKLLCMNWNCKIHMNQSVCDSLRERSLRSCIHIMYIVYAIIINL